MGHNQRSRPLRKVLWALSAHTKFNSWFPLIFASSTHTQLQYSNSLKVVVEWCMRYCSMKGKHDRNHWATALSGRAGEAPRHEDRYETTHKTLADLFWSTRHRIDTSTANALEDQRLSQQARALLDHVILYECLKQLGWDSWAVNHSCLTGMIEATTILFLFLVNLNLWSRSKSGSAITSSITR